MATKLSSIIEKMVKLKDGSVQHQMIHVNASAGSREEAADLPLESFSADLYIDGKLIADIAWVLGKTPALEALIEDTDWEKLYYDKNLNT